MTDNSTAWSNVGNEGPPGAPPTGSPPPPPEEPRRDGPAWERRQSILDLGAMLVTVRDVLVDAPNTFRTMVRDGGMSGPLFFMLILGCIGGWVGMLWGILWSQAMGAAALGSGAMDLSALGVESNPELMAFMASATFQVIQALTLPALLLVVFFVQAAVFHLMLLIVGGAEQPFETTIRVVAYTSGATALFQMVPFCGSFIGMVWGIVVLILGLAHAHETSMGRSAAAVLLPLILCCFCCLLVILMAGMGVASLSNAGM